jgi:GT2 family glycosyltransferase
MIEKVDTKIELSIVIVSWNVKELLRNCLDSIRDKISSLSFEVIIIDNASSDSSVEMIREEFSWVTLVVNKENSGFAKANNQGIKMSQGRNILFLNPDTLIVSDAIQRMVARLDADLTLGAIGCRMLDFEGNLQMTCARNFPTPLNQFFEIMMLRRLFPKNKLFGNALLSYWDHKGHRYIDCFSGACFMVRKDVLNVIGGFDERYFMYAEDIDLCYRIKNTGFKLFYDGSIEILHYSGASSQRADKVAFASVMMREANFWFMRQYYGKIKAHEYKILTAVGALHRICVILIGMVLLRIVNENRMEFSMGTLLKYIKILSWSLGLEKWARSLTAFN